jgi:hypothetical protein
MSATQIFELIKTWLRQVVGLELLYAYPSLINLTRFSLIIIVARVTTIIIIILVCSVGSERSGRPLQ